MLDLQNGTNGRCRDSQRVLDELIEALEGYNEAVEGAGGGERHPPWVRQTQHKGGEGGKEPERGEISRGCVGEVFEELPEGWKGLDLMREGQGRVRGGWVQASVSSDKSGGGGDGEGEGRGITGGSEEEVIAELWRGGAGQGGVGRGRAEAGVRAQGRAAVIGISQGEGERSMRNHLSGREVQEWSEPSRDGLQGAEGGGQEGSMLTSDTSRRAAESDSDPHGLKLSCLERELRTRFPSSQGPC